MKKLFLVIFGLIALAVFIAVAATYLAGRDSAILADDVVLELNLSQPIIDYSPTPELPFFESTAQQGLADIYRSLHSARTDSRVKGLSVHIQSAVFGLAQAEELRRQIQAVAEHGKFVRCYLETAGEGTNGTLAYYVASACPSIVLAPAGELNVVGFFLDGTFYRGTLEKLEIDPEFEHVGDYKSAAEGFTEYGHSDSAREALSSLLDDLYERLVGDLSAARGRTSDEIRELIDGAPYTAAEALDLGLVDELAYPDEYVSAFDSALGSAWPRLDLADYTPSAATGRSKIAIAFAQGTIVRGQGGIDPWTNQMYIGADGFGDVLETLIGDDSIEAVVLRIDSPGGSAQASDLLLRQVERLAAVKPVVVSMSSLSASGGYYIAAKAQHIVAESTTLTGSIGVIAGRFVTGRFQSELLGITHDSIQRGANAHFFSSTDPMTDAQRERFVSMMTEVYDTFVDHVATGRGMEHEAVDAIAQGRIWSGQSAMDHGLVDQIGGFDLAVAMAAEAAGLSVDETRLVFYPKPPTLLEFLTGEGGSGILARWVRNGLMGGFVPPESLRVGPETTRLTRPY